ncbi:MAG: polysaccharide deacetylase family protein, partial [Bacteroidota bacterium]
MFYGSKNIDSGFFIKTVCKTESDNQVALTFDDGPVKGQTEKVLDILHNHGVKATFFCIGKRMQENPDLVKRIEREGHLVSNHSYTHHFLFDMFPFKRMLAELMDTNQVILKVTGKTNLYFRPPYGVTTPVLARAINRSGLAGIGWSVRS